MRCSQEYSLNEIKFAEFDWDSAPEHLSPPFDLILVSDCVLPKLYPIEPLVKVSQNAIKFYPKITSAC